MKYVYIVDGKAHEIIPEINPAFPTIPIEERYSQEFLSHCVVVEEDVEVECNWLYDPETGLFTEPVVEELEEDEVLKSIEE